MFFNEKFPLIPVLISFDPSLICFWSSSYESRISNNDAAAFLPEATSGKKWALLPTVIAEKVIA